MNTLNPSNPANRRSANFQFDETIKPEFTSVKGKGDLYVVSVTNIPVVNHLGSASCLTCESSKHVPFGAQEHRARPIVTVLDRFRMAEDVKKANREMPNIHARFNAYWLASAIMVEGNDFLTGARFNDEHVNKIRQRLYREQFRLGLLGHYGVINLYDHCPR